MRLPICLVLMLAVACTVEPRDVELTGGATGPAGATGPRGATGPAGPTGPSGAAADALMLEVDLAHDIEGGEGTEQRALLAIVNDLRARLKAIEPITSELTLDVPAEFPSVQAALASIDGRRIVPGGVVIVQIADGVYELSETITLSHPDGERIAIVGNVDEAAQVELRFTGVTGVLAQSGARAGQLKGLTLTGDFPSEPPGNHSAGAFGVLAVSGAQITLEPPLVVQGFGDTGIAAFRGAEVFANGVNGESVISRNNGVDGFRSFDGSVLRADQAQAMGNGRDGFRVFRGSVAVLIEAQAENNGGNGFFAVQSSTIYADDAVAGSHSATERSGFVASELSSIVGTRARASGNHTGFRAQGKSYIKVHECTANANTGFVFFAAAGSTISAHQCTASPNAGGVTAQTGSTIELLNANLEDSGQVVPAAVGFFGIAGSYVFE